MLMNCIYFNLLNAILALLFEKLHYINHLQAEGNHLTNLNSRNYHQ